MFRMKFTECPKYRWKYYNYTVISIVRGVLLSKRVELENLTKVVTNDEIR